MQIDALARDEEANTVILDFISSVISCFLRDVYTVLFLDLDKLANLDIDW